MATGSHEGQSVIDEKLSSLETEVNTEIARLQTELNEKIRRLRENFGEQKSRLNRQRNALSPVHRLPPEVISRILFASLATSQESKEISVVNPDARIHKRFGATAPWHISEHHYNFGVWRDVPDAIRLCHVCQYWRSVALAFPALWSHIQVGQKMRPELLELIRANAKRGLFTLDIRNLARPFDLKASDVLSDILKADVGQLASLALHCDRRFLTGSEPRLPVFQYLAGSADQLQSLQFVVLGRIDEGTELFLSAIPNLSCLELRGIVEPWCSPIFRSPQLTHLTLHNTPDFNALTTASFLSFLRQATKLICLYVELPRQSALTWEDVGGQPEAPVELPNVRVLQLISKCFAPLSLVMKAVHISDIRGLKLKVLCGEPDGNLQPICEFTHPRIAPERIEIGHGWSTVGGDGYILSCDFRNLFFDRNFRAWIPTCDEAPPWISFNAGTNFPFPELSTTQHRVPWCFSNLLVLVIGDVSEKGIPQEFWEELSMLSTLEVVHMKYARISLVAKFLRPILKVSKRPKPPKYPASSTAHPASHPFPRLRALVFGSLGKFAKGSVQGLRLAGYGVPEQWEALAPPDLYLEFVSSYLRCWRDYGHRRLVCISLQAETTLAKEASDHESQAMFHAIDVGVLGRVKAIAQTVVFGRTAVWDHCAEREATASTLGAVDTAIPSGSGP